MAKILVIEDVDAVRRAIVSVLRTLGGHDVITASDGQMGLEVLEKETVDLTVTDIWMPKEDGISFLQKAKERYPAMPVIVVTGGGPNFPPIELSASIMESHGADQVLIKPFDDEDLLAAVAKLTTT